MDVSCIETTPVETVVFCFIFFIFANPEKKRNEFRRVPCSQNSKDIYFAGYRVRKTVRTYISQGTVFAKQ